MKKLQLTSIAILTLISTTSFAKECVLFVDNSDGDKNIIASFWATDGQDISYKNEQEALTAEQKDDTDPEIVDTIVPGVSRVAEVTGEKCTFYVNLSTEDSAESNTTKVKVSGKGHVDCETSSNDFFENSGCRCNGDKGNNSARANLICTAN